MRLDALLGQLLYQLRARRAGLVKHEHDLSVQQIGQRLQIVLVGDAQHLDIYHAASSIARHAFKHVPYLSQCFLQLRKRLFALTIQALCFIQFDERKTHGLTWPSLCQIG